MVGMDVHARSIYCEALAPDTGEAWQRRFSGEGMVGELVGWLQGLPQPVRCCYESGCTGLRQLADSGVDCSIMAVSTLPRSSKDRRRKNDRRDARVVLGEMCNPASKVSYAWVPDRETEGARDLARAAYKASRATVAAKLKVESLLLKHGFAWNDLTPAGNLRGTWTQGYRKWARTRDLGDELSQQALGRLIAAVEAREGEERELRRLVAEAASGDRWKPVVDALCMLKGVDVATAFLAAAEFGDFSRFGSGRAASSMLGATPTEHISDGKGVRGGISKEGPAELRSALCESCAQMSRRGSAPKRARRGHEVSPEVERIAAAADRRLKGKYDALVARGKGKLKARMACVSEMARWIWVIGRQVQSERAAS